MKGQVQRILEGNSPEQIVDGVAYKGQPPVYSKTIDPETKCEGFVKIQRGVPFVRPNHVSI